MEKIENSGPVEMSKDETGLAVITINRPERKNALNLVVKEQLANYVESLAADDSVHVIVLTGANGVFVAGTDIAEMATMTPTEHTKLVTDRVFTVLRQCQKPIIAAIESYALGGGCELALACDIIIAGKSAQIGQPEIRVGIMPGAGGTQRLVRTVGKYRAMYMMLTGAPVTADEALAMGILSEITEDGKALEKAIKVARIIIKMPPLAVRAIKEVVRFGQDVPMETSLLLERKAFQLLFDTKDQKEGMNAFLEKRTPVYQGS